LSLKITGAVYGEARHSHTGQHFKLLKFSKMLTVYCPRANSPCENVILENIVPGITTNYQVHIEKTEILNAKDIGQMNE
jgi:hypothetical protein